MRYVKIIDKYTIEDAPKNKDGIINYNFDTERLLLDGYKPLVISEHPEYSRLYKKCYSEDESNIYENIEYLETQEEALIRRFNSVINEEIEKLSKQIDELDKKRIRAICEPIVKDESTGETWLDYYNNQVVAIRVQIQELKERITPNDVTQQNLPPLDSGQ